MEVLTASLEPIAAVVRVHAEGGRYGDQYTWAATVRWIDHETVEIVGVTKCPTPAEWRAIQRCMGEAGVKTIRFKRIKDGREQVHTVKTIFRGVCHGQVV